MVISGAALGLAVLGAAALYLPRVDGSMLPRVELPYVGPSLSSAAQRIDRLIDVGKFEAAATLLEGELARHPDDAGLHYVEARCLIAREPVLALIDESGSYERVVQSCQRAVEFDESLRPLVARMLVHDLSRSLKTDAESAGYVCAPDLAAYVQSKREQFGGAGDLWPDDALVEEETGPFGGFAVFGLELQVRAQFGHTFVGGPWVLLLRAAREFDAGAAQSAASELDAPARAFADHGKYTSALLVASLREELAGARGASNLLACCAFLTPRLEGLASRGAERGRALVACDALFSAFPEELTAQRESAELQALAAALRRELPADVGERFARRHGL
ncbi:MAG: hypothetical protein IT454_15265 [Planctomycetes bacterium]|nr:hypothetical protein [Planctomycetota bacterium]